MKVYHAPIPAITPAPIEDPLASPMSGALDGDVQGSVRQLSRPGENGHQVQSAANASPQVKQLKASEAAANTAVIQRKASNATGLPDDLKAGIEALSGFSLGHVRVHYNSSKPAEVNALAFAEGNEIYVAPGQEQHLPEEAWHIVQQMQGRVKATTAIKGAAVNTDASLEREAESMGAKALTTRQNNPEKPRKTATPPAAQVKQLKSRITNIVADEDVKTPIKALSDHLKPYFEKAEVSEVYYFHDSKILSLSTYSSSYLRARSVTAEIDKRSTNKKSKRTGSIIQHYGHFGVMERSIMGRSDRGNLFDGGHLIERSLMNGGDADRHGNLAPQENKEFNQNLMRGWEHIPESYQDKKTFTYQMKVSYTQDQYTRTGAKLIEAGIVHQGLVDMLKHVPDDTHGDWAEKLKQTSFLFDTWVPYEWKGKIIADRGDFSERNVNKGSHFDKLEPSREEARNRVVSFDPGNTNSPILTNAGVVAGFITDTSISSLSGQERLHFGGKKVIKSYMYSGVPQPLDIQPINDRNGKAPVSKLPSMSRRINILEEEFNLQNLFDTLIGAELYSQRHNRATFVAATTFYGRVSHSREVRILRKYATKEQIMELAKKLKRLVNEGQNTTTTDGARKRKREDEDTTVTTSKKKAKISETKSLTTREFQEISIRILGEPGKAFVSNVVYDPQFRGIMSTR